LPTVLFLLLVLASSSSLYCASSTTTVSAAASAEDDVVVVVEQQQRRKRQQQQQQADPVDDRDDNNVDVDVDVDYYYGEEEEEEYYDDDDVDDDDDEEEEEEEEEESEDEYYDDDDDDSEDEEIEDEEDVDDEDHSEEEAGEEAEKNPLMRTLKAEVEAILRQALAGGREEAARYLLRATATAAVDETSAGRYDGDGDDNQPVARVLRDDGDDSRPPDRHERLEESDPAIFDELIRQAMANILREEYSSATDAEEEEEEEDVPDDRHSFYYADRHVKAANQVAGDEDCMVREFDVLSEEYSADDAVAVLSKCRILVLRNAFDREYVAKSYKPKVGRYLRALQRGKIDYRNKALFDETYPTNRYEILLPSRLADKNVTENERVLEILRDADVLDMTFRMHSFGAVVTEPGAPHQEWHDEDNYLWDRDNAFYNHGVAGHDLPPYMINLFTPLVDLSYDHGPTEFCVGSSHTTGLLSGGYELYDETLTVEGDGSDFQQMLEFHADMDNKPCPAQFLRSVLLKVGDAILFDYQIVHRAGHNASPDTRAQIYVAYSRSWFKDLNYHVNTHGDAAAVNADDGGVSAYARFALLDAEKGEIEASEHCETPGCAGEPPIETLRNILPQGDDNDDYELLYGKGYDVEDEDATTPLVFYVSNVDLEEGSSVSVDDDDSYWIAPGSHIEVEASVGSKLSVRNPEGDVLKTWTLPRDMEQLMVSKAVVGVPTVDIVGSVTESLHRQHHQEL